MAGIIDLGAFHHQEEALLGLLGQFVDRRPGNVRQEIQRFLCGVRAHAIVQADHLAGSPVYGQGVRQIAVSIGLNAGEHIDAIRTGILDIVPAAAADEVHVAGEPVAGDFVRAVAFGGMAVEDGRRGVCDIAQGDDARGLAEALEIVRQRGILHRTVLVRRNVARPGDFPRRERTAARGGIADEIVVRVVELDADVLDLQQAQVAVVRIGASHDLVDAHAVADEEDHVLDLLVAAVVPVRGRIGRNPLGELQPLILEAGKVTRGLIQLFRAGYTGLHLVLADDEVLVAPVVEEEAGHGGLVGVDNVNAELPEGEIGRRPLRRIPEADGLPGGVRRGDGRIHGIQFRVDHPAFAIPFLRELAEVRAEHSHPGELVRRVADNEVRIQVAIEKDPVRIGGEVLIIRCITGDDHLHATVGAEDIRVFAEEFYDLGQGGFRGRFEFHHQDEGIVRTLPHPAAVLAEHRHNRVHIHRAEVPFRGEVLDFMANQKLVVMPKDVSLDGGTVLGIGLPEGRRALVVIVRVQDDGALGEKGQRAQQDRKGKEAFHDQ